MRFTRKVRSDPQSPRRLVLALAAASLLMWAPPTNAVPAPPQFSMLPSPPFDVSTTDPRGRWIGSPFIPTERYPGSTPRSAGTRGSDDRPYATLSGTLIKGAAATTTWALYPGACVEISQGVWAPKTYAVADSLQPTPGFPYSSGYTVGQPGGSGGNAIGYTREDQSTGEPLWHVVSSAVPANQRPAIIGGQRMLWCGKYVPGSTYPIGYGNSWAQILYLDTGAHAAPYYLIFDGTISAENAFDRVRIIGGGGGERDPLGNRSECYCFASPYWNTFPRPYCQESTPCAANEELLLEFTGDFVGGEFPALGQIESRMEGPAVGHYRIGPIPAEHRAIYIFFFSDGWMSSLDGFWTQSQGILLDNIDTSDNGAIYTDQVPVGGVDEFGGRVVLGTSESPIVSCRVFPGYGTYWSLVAGTAVPTDDICAPQRSMSDLLLHDGDPSTHTAIEGMKDEIRTCSIPVPAGTVRIVASWDSYGVECGHGASVSFFRDGVWEQPWWAGYVGGSVWNHWSENLAIPLDIDSVRLHFNVSCGFGADGGPPLLIDNIGLQFVSGEPPPGPIIDYAWGPRSTFIDGTIRGTYCSQTPCWPRDSMNDDNWNTEEGFDEVRIILFSSLRRGGSGLGLNWRTAGRDLSQPRSGYNPAYDVPRLIYRLFDPTTLTWSPWDSTAILATPTIVDSDGAGPAPPETTTVDFTIDWPPPDKVAAGASLPGGFTINGVSSYSALSWLPRGTRMQYYWKAVDIAGGVTYSFHSYWRPEWSTVGDGEIPTLPCHDSPGCVGPTAPAINEWSVLPGVYPPGPPGSLLAGRTNTPILLLDDRYGSVAQALRALGVRADLHHTVELGGDPKGWGGPAHWPNYEDYPILDSLAAWYRIIIAPMYGKGNFEEWTGGVNTTAYELSRWLETDTGPDGGDRCLFLAGDDALYSFTGSNGPSSAYLASQVLGVASATECWLGASTNPYPSLDDRISAPIPGPGLAAPGTYRYTVDGGCVSTARSGYAPGDYFAPPRFDALSRVVDGNTRDALFYPNGQVAGIARTRDTDLAADRDRQKTLATGFSMEYVRDAGIPPTSSGYDHSGLLNRAQILYKFLTSCRGARTSSPSDTGTCWPCPTPGTGASAMGSDWSGMDSGFETATYGPLYPIQARLIVSGVLAEDTAPEHAPRVNRIDGNYPNPFNPRTTLRFQSASAGEAEIRIFSVGGRLVRTLRTKVKDGRNEIAWDARGGDGRPLASGIYFYTIRFPDSQSLRGPNHLVIVK